MSIGTDKLSPNIIFWILLLQVSATASTSPLVSPQQQTPVSVGAQRSPGGVSQPDSRLEETKMALVTLQTEYDTYKKEKDENAR